MIITSGVIMQSVWAAITFPIGTIINRWGGRGTSGLDFELEIIAREEEYQAEDQQRQDRYTYCLCRYQTGEIQVLSQRNLC